MKVFIISIIQFALLVASLPTIHESGFTNDSTVATPSDLIVRKNSTGIITLGSSSVFGNRNKVQALDVKLSYKCETTTGSPHVNNIRASAQKLRNLPADRWCVVKNSVGSRCTRMSVTGDAEIGICGEYDWGVLCRNAAAAVDAIADNCEWFGLAGGQVRFSWPTSVRLIVYHS